MFGPPIPGGGRGRGLDWGGIQGETKPMRSPDGAWVGQTAAMGGTDRQHHGGTEQTAPMGGTDKQHHGWDRQTAPMGGTDKQHP